ncbi:MAG: hypothetical protein KatS3mg095_0056 [Candidatus Parcubacteria bacterium]|nr:MAG: hypothetical protein KatS3mg095_0056 [Candidatus Parcubacteria bacterium]
MNNFYPNTPLSLIQFYTSDIIGRIISFLPNLILALIFILLGYLIGWILELFIRVIILRLNINKYLSDLGFNKFLEKSNIELKTEVFLGKLIFWIVFLLFLIASFDILGLSSFSQLLNEVVKFIPRALVAAFIFVFAILLGDFLRRTLYVFLRGIEVRGAEAGSDIVYYVILIFGIILALSQLGVVTDILNILVFGIALAFALALGLSFGLGGQDLAREFLNHLKRKLQ